MVYGTDENVYVEIASMYNMVNVLLNNTDMHHLSRTLAKYNTNTRKSIDILHHFDINTCIKRRCFAWQQGTAAFIFPDTEGSMKHHDPFEQRDKKVWQQRSAEGH